MPIATHIVFALLDRRVIATNTAERREYARIVTRVGEKYGLLSHGMPDNHGHLVAACNRAAAGQCARAVETALRHGMGIAVPFSPAYFKPVNDQSHLRSVIRYVHRQAAHHGVATDRFGDASSLQDLVGARLIGGDYLSERVAALAPRIRPEQLVPETLRATSLPSLTIEQAAEAAAATVALATLSGQTPRVRRARRAALAVAAPAGRERCAAALACSPRTITRLVGEPVVSQFAKAIRIQASWRFGMAEAS